MLPPSSSSALTLLTLSLSLLTLTSAQNQASLPDLSKLPECAQKSATKGIASTSCTLTDFTCICKSASFIEAVGASIASLCSPADQQATLAFANAVCGPLGVNLPTGEIASAGPSSSAATAATQVPSSSSAAGGAMETYAAPSAVEDVTAATTSAGAMGMASVTPPYPIASNGSASNMTNQTALPFEGGASSQQTRPLQLVAVGVTVLLAGAGFSFL
ncbi:MAG: hypothetical protein OHK93_003477 [Ramalina farinacea]|uniref:CFEM domain-containing protein n=1 Tax=Ramalina farinacea TaxID=258253 RepID=A0AA43QTG7_9LECA|nr:hypothetical protein [Ramalina farinacea]